MEGGKCVSALPKACYVWQAEGDNTGMEAGCSLSGKCQDSLSLSLSLLSLSGRPALAEQKPRCFAVCASLRKECRRKETTKLSAPAVGHILPFVTRSYKRGLKSLGGRYELRTIQAKEARDRDNHYVFHLNHTP